MSNSEIFRSIRVNSTKLNFFFQESLPESRDRMTTLSPALRKLTLESLTRAQSESSLVGVSSGDDSSSDVHDNNNSGVKPRR